MIITLQGYNIELPEPPPVKKIYLSELPIEDQYWQRPYSYTDEEYSHLSYETQTEIAEIEDDRCRNGFWFMNKGEPFWITGDNYFFLTHWTIEGLHPYFIKNQAYDFYFYRYCELDPKCFGSIELKPRQEGCTHRKLATLVNKAIRIENRHIGIQSKTGDDAEKVNFDGIKKGFQKLSYWMRPKIKAHNVSGELAFEQPPNRNMGSKRKKAFKESEEYLNTKIDWKTTTVKAYDGKHLYYYLMDEYFKWETANAYDAWFTHRRCLGDEFEMWGKAFLLSTVGVDQEKEKVSEEAIQNGLKLWNESNINEKDSLGFTKTGLYRWFIPAWASKRGRSPRSGEPLIDVYGNVNEFEAKNILLEKRRNETNPRRRIIIIRQDPMTVQEALSTMVSVNSTFDNERLMKRLDFLNGFEPTPERPVKYRIGNLHWSDNIKFSKVKFVDNPNGKFRIAYFPEVAGEMANRVKVLDNGAYAPYSDSQFVMGIDHFDFDAVQHGEGSKGAFHIKLRFNFFNPELSHIYCLEYLERPSSALILYDDIFKGMFFYGAKIQPERKNYGLFRELKRNNLLSFSLRRPDITKNSAYKKRDNDFGTPTSDDTIQIGCELIENYFSLPDPETNENTKDSLEYFWFDRTIEQLIQFDPNQTVKYDAVMSMIHTEIGSQALKKYHVQESFHGNSRDNRTAVDYLAPIYGSNGQIITHHERMKQQQQKKNRNQRIFL